MEEFKENATKVLPTKLVNILLQLKDNHSQISKDDVTSINEVKEKIAFVQNLISSLKKDVGAGVVSKTPECEKLGRSRAGHLSQITIQYSKFVSEYDNLDPLTDKEHRSEILVTLDQVCSGLEYQLKQVENKTIKLELLLDEDALTDLIGQNATYSDKVFYCKSK